MSMDTPQWRQWLAEHPGWDAWFERQLSDWVQMHVLEDRGHTPGQAASMLGQVPEQLDAEELEEKLEKSQRREKELEAIRQRGQAESLAQRYRIAELEEKLATALAQLAAQAERPSRQRGRRAG
jgi:hypothetical protein